MTDLPAGTPTEMYVDGKWTGGSNGSFEVLDPATGGVITSVPRAGEDDVTAAIGAAEAALPGWAATAPRERGDVLRRAFEAMLSRREEIAFVMSLEMGKSLADSRAEVTYAAEFFRWFSEEAVRVGGELRRAPAGANRILTFPKPVGVSLLLTPWNFPAAMATRKIGPALAAGCTVVLKPASDTPLTALVLAQVLAEAGAPAGVVNVLTTDDSSGFAKTALADPRVRKLSFTGSTPVGSLLLKQAAERIVKCSMELGGNAPFLVLSDASIDDAVEGAMLAKMRNGGQACTAANRFLVHESVADEFASRLAEQMSGLRVGPGTDEKTQLGPMVNPKAVEGIHAKVESSVGAGASVVTGGSPGDGAGAFYPPTVLSDVPRDAAVVTEEVFGPVAPIVRVSSDEDAIALANSVDLGLTAYVYSADLGRALHVAEALEVGMVGINRGIVSDPAAPFGGVKESGLGREGGFEGIDEYLETQYVAANW